MQASDSEMPSKVKHTWLRLYTDHVHAHIHAHIHIHTLHLYMHTATHAHSYTLCIHMYIAEIRSVLPEDVSMDLPSAVAGQGLRFRVARTGRSWPGKMSVKLREIVADSMVFELSILKRHAQSNALRNTNALGSDTAQAVTHAATHAQRRDDITQEATSAQGGFNAQNEDVAYASQNVLASDAVVAVAPNDESIRLGLRDEMRARGSEEGMLWLVNELDAALQGVHDSEKFWHVFWEGVADALNMYPRKTGRECQIHWTHTYHPGLNRNPQWTKEEETRLLQVLDETSGVRRWEEIAAKIGTGRSAFDVYRHYQTALNVGLISETWSLEEIEKLRSLVKEYKGRKSKLWFSVAERLGTKTNEQCRAKWEAYSKESLKMGQWSVHEDLFLQACVQMCGRGNWIRVADNVPLRTDLQCRERYENVLAPELHTHNRWSKSDDDRLLEAVQKYGPGNWSLVAVSTYTQMSIYIYPHTHGHTHIDTHILFSGHVENRISRTD